MGNLVDLSGDTIIQLLMESSGLTFSELCRVLGLDPSGHDAGPMLLLNCLLDLNAAGLISVDGVRSRDIHRFIHQEMNKAIYQEIKETSGEEGIAKRIRVSDNWRRNELPRSKLRGIRSTFVILPYNSVRCWA